MSRFDEFGPDYAERLSRLTESFGGEDALYYTRQKADVVIKLVAKYLGDIARLKFLDIGCGTGEYEQIMAQSFKLGAGLDLSQGMLKAAKKTDNCILARANARNIPFENACFDVAFSMTLMHHLNEDDIVGALGEMKRVVKPAGLVINFDHNPYNPVTRAVVSRCEFDRDAKLIRPGKLHRFYRNAGLNPSINGYIFFFPKFLHSLVRFEQKLKWLPIGAQYYVGAIV